MSRRKQSNPKPVKIGVGDELVAAMEEEASNAGKSVSASDEGAAPSPAPSSASGSDDLRSLDHFRVKKEAEDNAEEAAESTESTSAATIQQSRKRKADDHSRPASSTSTEHNQPEEFSTVSQLINPDILQSLQYFALLRQSFPGVSLFNGPQTSSTNPTSTEIPSPLLPVTKAMSDSSQSCPACGICFSSQSTLNAHLTYYCSQRSKFSSDKTLNDKSAARSDTPEALASATHRESPLDDASAPKIRRSGRYYACPYCSFSADKRVSLNRHMRVHVGLPLLATHPISPPPESGENRNSAELPADRKSGPETPEVLPDRFCQECKIQFSSVSTYQVHKQHYCRIRNFPASSGRPASSASSAQPRTKTPIMDPSIPRLILPTQPPIAIPLCIAQAAKILTPEDPLPPHAIIVSPEGELQFQRETLRESFPAPETLLREEEEDNSAASSSAEVQPEPEEVLDLSSKPADLKRVKEPSPGTLRIREELARVQPNPQIPSIPFLPPKVFAELEALGMCLGVPSGHEMASNPAQWLSMLETAVLTATSPTLVPSPAAAAPPVAKPATIPCEDCNISFRRMESYLVHRQFYCAARQREKSESANSNRTEGNADEEPNLNPNREKLVPHKPPKIPCDQCGIEFESANTLQAHKTYYCLKGNAADSVSVSSNEEPEKTTQNENTTATIKVEENVVAVENNSATTPTTVVQRPDSNSPSAAAQSSAGLLPQSPGWKCPCCDLVSPTAAAAQKHIETHSNVRAFRCSLCGYRGNTLRGMRTHVRIHFDRRITDQCEDNYISCILSPEGPQTTTSAVSPGPGSSSDLEQLCRSLGIRPEICSKILSSSPETSAAMLALGKLTNDGSNPSLAALQFLQLAQRMSSHSPGPTTGAGCRSDKLFLCDLCCYSSSYRGNVIRHSKLVHGREINDVAVVASNFLQATKPNMADHAQQQSARIPPLPLEKLVVPVSPVPQQTPRLSALPVEKLVVPVSPPLEALTPPLKKEPVEAGPDSPTAGDSNENMQKHCKSCNITFNYMSTYLAHKKYYCSSHAAEAAAAPAEPTHA